MNAPAAKLAQEDVAFQRGLYEDGNATRRSLHQYRRDWVLDQVARFSKSGDAVLEVGVGCGVFTEALSQTGRKVSAVDINPAFLENVRLLDAVETHLLDATNPLGLGQHDLAICSEVLEHVPSERSEMLLSAVAGSLRPGGTFILTTPQRYATVEMMAGLFRFKPVLALARMVYGNAEPLGHINLLTADELGGQIRRAGFDVVDTSRFGFYLPVIAEFGGNGGAVMLKLLDRTLAKAPFARGLLWTQAWVLRKPVVSPPA
ncbi:class I SAM-dependent methyltransferase [Sphingomonas sp.]|uniref:class I SAM-dependent methyltransferase n=1 Tax=Sphingomonas sp. TaxID=28214 RepID=UPI0025F73D0B|nr:class I SAM-dependent methyltransferase [Sphingomonas sp.]